MKKNGLRFLVALLILGMLFSACESTPKASGQGGELAAFKGEWQSFHIYLDEPELEADYKVLADKMPNYTVSGIKAATHAMYDTPVLKAKFDGTNKVVFTVNGKDGKEVERAIEYVYKGKKPVPGYDGYFWETFEAKKDVPGLLNAKYFVAFPPHQHGENGLLHWHARFGAKSIEALVNADAYWWPTFTTASYTREEMIGHCRDSLSFLNQMFPVSPFEPYTNFSDGLWINSAAIYHNTSPEVEAAYAKVIKEFAGKNPKGGDFTKADIIAEAEKVFGTTARYTHVKFNIKNGVNELILLKNGKEVFRSSYKRVGETEAKPGRLTVKADNKSAGDMTYIAFTGAHGIPTHTHFWHAATSDLSVCKGTPTCIPADTPNEQIAIRVEKSARWVLNSLIGN